MTALWRAGRNGGRKGKRKKARPRSPPGVCGRGNATYASLNKRWKAVIFRQARQDEGEKRKGKGQFFRSFNPLLKRGTKKGGEKEKANALMYVLHMQRERDVVAVLVSALVEQARKKKRESRWHRFSSRGDGEKREGAYSVLLRPVLTERGKREKGKMGDLCSGVMIGCRFREKDCGLSSTRLPDPMKVSGKGGGKKKRCPGRREGKGKGGSGLSACHLLDSYVLGKKEGGKRCPSPFLTRKEGREKKKRIKYNIYPALFGIHCRRKKGEGPAARQ